MPNRRRYARPAGRGSGPAGSPTTTSWPPTTATWPGWRPTRPPSRPTTARDEDVFGADPVPGGGLRRRRGADPVRSCRDAVEVLRRLPRLRGRDRPDPRGAVHGL